MKRNVAEHTLTNRGYNYELRDASGQVDIDSKLVSFLYVLMRDYMATGDVEALVRYSEEPSCQYTNGWLAKYAEHLAARLK